MSVAARVRPALARERAFREVVSVTDGRVLTLTGGEGGTHAGSRRFAFDAAFSGSAGQEALFSHVLPLVDAAVAGYNCTIFAYGQTGTGKTFTMLGPDMWAAASTSEEAGEA